MDPDRLLPELLAGNTAALARAISMVENQREGFEYLLGQVHAVGHGLQSQVGGDPQQPAGASIGRALRDACGGATGVPV